MNSYGDTSYRNGWNSTTSRCMNYLNFSSSTRNAYFTYRSSGDSTENLTACSTSDRCSRNSPPLFYTGGRDHSVSNRDLNLSWSSNNFSWIPMDKYIIAIPVYPEFGNKHLLLYRLMSHTDVEYITTNPTTKTRTTRSPWRFHISFS